MESVPPNSAVLSGLSGEVLTLHGLDVSGLGDTKGVLYPLRGGGEEVGGRTMCGVPGAGTAMGMQSE